MSNSTLTTLLALAIGDILKWEATNLTRESVPAEAGTKAGQLVDYPLRGQKLVALTDEKNGKVVVQPHNCVINLSVLSKKAMASGPVEPENTEEPGETQPAVSIDDLIKEGDTYGIVYRGKPLDI